MRIVWCFLQDSPHSIGSLIDRLLNDSCVNLYNRREAERLNENDGTGSYMMLRVC